MPINFYHTYGDTHTHACTGTCILTRTWTCNLQTYNRHTFILRVNSKCSLGLLLLTSPEKNKKYKTTKTFINFSYNFNYMQIWRRYHYTFSAMLWPFVCLCIMQPRFSHYSSCLSKCICSDKCQIDGNHMVQIS